jgi:hypothetical protein
MYQMITKIVPSIVNLFSLNYCASLRHHITLLLRLIHFIFHSFLLFLAKSAYHHHEVSRHRPQIQSIIFLLEAMGGVKSSHLLVDKIDQIPPPVDLEVGCHSIPPKKWPQRQKVAKVCLFF